MADTHEEPTPPRMQPGPARSGPSFWGEPAAVLDAHWAGVFRLALRLTGSRHEAADIAQETFLRALRRHASFTPGTSLSAWLARIATNVFLDARRKQREARLDHPPAAAAGPEPVETREAADRVQQALNALPEVQRIVFLLRVFEELPFSQIAPIVGVGEAGARWHMLQARRELMRALEEKP